MYLLRRKTTLIRPFNFINSCNIFHVKALDFFYSRSLIARLIQGTGLKLSFVFIYHFIKNNKVQLVTTRFMNTF